MGEADSNKGEGGSPPQAYEKTMAISSQGVQNHVKYNAFGHFQDNNEKINDQLGMLKIDGLESKTRLSRALGKAFHLQIYSVFFCRALFKEAIHTGVAAILPLPKENPKLPKTMFFTLFSCLA